MIRVHGIIRRRLLVNFRIDPEVAQRHLPAPFRPKLHDGYAVGGICLIRLEGIRPKRLPRLIGISSENAAHRFAVTWDGREGVYIPRRDTGSRINVLAGGRLFPGEHHRATFNVTDDGDRIDLAMRSDGANVHVVAKAARQISAGSIFGTLDEASRFFEPGSLGYSATSRGDHLDGIVLHTREWRVEPLEVESVATSYFDDDAKFPRGSIAFDCALIMRNLAHEWEAAEELYT